MCLYKAMIPFSWYHRGDKRHGPFVLLYNAVHIYILVYTDHHFYTKVYTCYYNKQCIISDLYCLCLRHLCVKQNEIVRVSWKRRIDFMLIMHGTSNIKIGCGCFIKKCIYTLLCTSFCDYEVIKVISCRLDTAFN
jgi:hypothetical protein